jgi:hypothetical protein
MNKAAHEKVKARLATLKPDTKRILRKMWEEAGPRLEDTKPKLKEGEKAVVDGNGGWLVLAPATTGRFKLNQRVRVSKDIPDFNEASASKPPIGLEGTVVLGRKYEPRFMVPKGKVAVRFSAKALGYLDYHEPGRRFCYYFIPESVLTAVKRPRTAKSKKAG